MRNSLIVAALGLFLCFPLRAQTPLPYQQIVQYQKTAQTALQSQASQEGKDCPNAASMYDVNTCMRRVADQTNRDFDLFYQSLLSIISSNQDSADRLKKAEDQWMQYRQLTCDAIFDFYKPGTIAPSAQMQCEVQLTRSRMRDLEAIYHTPLHN